MVIENLTVNENVKEMEGNWEKGFWDGIESLGKPLPSFVTQKVALMWKPYERGYWLGREVALVERNLNRDTL